MIISVCVYQPKTGKLFRPSLLRPVADTNGDGLLNMPSHRANAAIAELGFSEVPVRTDAWTLIFRESVVSIECTA